MKRAWFIALLTLIAAGLTVTGLTLSGSAQAATARPAAAVPAARLVVFDCSGHAVVRPKDFVLACADGNSAVEKLTWTSWTPGLASAKGTLRQNDCTPYCAAGHFHDYPVSLTLSNPRRCPDGYHDYRTATAQYTSPRRDGKLGKLSLLCPLKG